MMRPAMLSILLVSLAACEFPVDWQDVSGRGGVPTSASGTPTPTEDAGPGPIDAAPVWAADTGSPVPSSGDENSACTLPVATASELIARWNKAAAARGTPIDFTWPACDQFPHPTYRGGTQEAYGEFAAVLLEFFELTDDFEFLSAHALFDVQLRYVFPSGQVGMVTTFRKLASDFSSEPFGTQSADTREALAVYLGRMN